MGLGGIFFSKLFFSRLSDPPRYTHRFMKYIVTIGEEITPYIELQSKNFPTSADLEKLREASVSPLNYMNTLDEFRKIRDVSSFIEHKDFILFKYVHDFQNWNTVIYHKETGRVVSTNFFKNDLIYKNDYQINEEFAFSDSKGAYVIKAENAKKRLKEAIRNNETVLDLDKADGLLQLEEDANPVILYYEFK